MIKEEIGGYEEPPCPPRAPRKTNSWIPIVVAVLGGLAVLHVAGLTKPLAGLAQQLRHGGRTPGWRLVGDWESNNDPMFQRVCHPSPKDDYGGTGIYLADAGRGMREVIFKVVSEDRNGRQVEIAEYLPEIDANYRVRYSVADDGKSMTREYEGRNGKHYTCQYRYVGPPTVEDPVREHRP